MTPTRHPRPRRIARWATAALAGTALVAASLMSAGAATAAPPQSVDPTHPDFGPNVTVFSPDTPLSEVRDKLHAIADQQRNNEMGTERQAVYFLPGQ